MKKTIWVILAAVSTLLILTGCSSNSSEHKSSASSKAELVKSSSSKKKHSEKKKESSSEKESSSSSLSSEVSSSSSTDGEGYVITPEAMRGTWYSKGEDGMTKLVISEHEITLISADGETNHAILYKRTKDTPSDVSESERQSKEEWRSAGNIGTNGISMRGWYQLQGGGEHFFTHEEEINGQKVPLVLYGFGANDLTDYVYYPSEDLANQQSDAKYDDINYKF
ncbi:hypothetical protein CR166_08485 [Ligilactobacillus salivarius]|uniref:hypothetical protein n=1 Tax=Ligilactobacillus salivarius TaxID=1624 RepID=UPI000C14BFCF|nr:hypothetical protein [Ligilactobacillus salivarius]PHY97398.1 hypothetical protein CR166_08485 [Ligilactobacillus salivarius]